MKQTLAHVGRRLLAPITSARDEGQGMAEYGLILAGVAILAIVAVFLLGSNIGNLLNRISSSLS